MTNPNRQPAGVPTGGQFAPDARGRSGVSLGSPGRGNDCTGCGQPLEDDGTCSYAEMDAMEGIDHVAGSPASEFAEQGMSASDAPRWHDAGFGAGEAAAFWDNGNGVDVGTAEMWGDEGFNAAESKAWRAAGFGAREAGEWITEDPTVTPAKALEWKQSGFTPEEYTQWGDVAGLTLDQAREYRQWGVTEPLAARDFLEAKIDGAYASTWCTTLGIRGIEPGYHGSMAGDWKTKGFSPAQMATWLDQGFLHVDSAEDWGWGGGNFEPAEAALWHKKVFGAREARGWADAGFTPEQADYFATRGLDSRNARREMNDPRAELPPNVRST